MQFSHFTVNNLKLHNKQTDGLKRERSGFVRFRKLSGLFVASVSTFNILMRLSGPGCQASAIYTASGLVEGQLNPGTDRISR